MDCSQLNKSLNILLDLQSEFNSEFFRLNENNNYSDQSNKQLVDKLFFLMEVIKRAKESMETQLSIISFDELVRWLKDNNLESKLYEKSLEAHMQKQEEFYRKFYGPDFVIDRSRIMIERSRLKAIAVGLNRGIVNYPLIIATPETISENEQSQSEAQFAYHRLLEPLQRRGLDIDHQFIRDKMGLTLEERLAAYVPVKVNDFNNNGLDFEKDWIAEIRRIIKAKGCVPKVAPRQVKLVFTFFGKNAPSISVDIDGKRKELTVMLTDLVKSRVQLLNPQEWITLAAQRYDLANNYLADTSIEWVMAVLDHQGRQEDKAKPVSFGLVSSMGGSSSIWISSQTVDYNKGYMRWRCGL